MNKPAAGESVPRELTLDEVQGQVTQIWEICLGRESISAHDNFFDLGGSSIAAMCMASMLNERFAADIAFQRIMELNDVASTAQFLFRYVQSVSGGSATGQTGEEAL